MSSTKRRLRHHFVELTLRLIIQPTIILWLIVPWLDIFPDRHLLVGFHKLIENINQFQSYFPNG
ncbi:hypothetical protein [Planktothrix sp. FACHB-1365]|uniref:hypothetical protein n=1 Tax=Planktothrix sp. FACHB-1365 TaxID=2692855 RepID=UPI001682528F|nr:hypothetical protein [Planktothrix sp. FACHB-1365]MBD2480999.1 hypothetical protein [Planktothrix sp. FACHB-1365]